MDDSSIFIQWAMETLGQGQHAAVAGDAFSSSPFLEPRHSAALQSGTDVAAHRYGATDSRSSGNRGAAMAMENDGRPPSCSTNYPAVSWNFASGIARPRINEAIPTSPAAPGHGEPEPARRSPLSTKSSTASNGTASTGQEHVIAERKRREKLNRHFIELSSVIPGLKKMDKTTILSDAVRYVKEQQEKLKALQDRDERTIDSVELVKRPCISNVDDGSPSPPPSAVKTSLPEIDARILERNLMVRIHCEDGKGILVALLAEVEGLHLTITHTNVMSFPASTLIINLMAKVDEGFNITMEDIVCKLDSALGRRHHGGNNNMEDRMNMKMLIKN